MHLHLGHIVETLGNDMETYFQKPETSAKRITFCTLFLHQNLSAAAILCQNFTGVIQPEKCSRKLEPVLDAKEQSWTSRRGPGTSALQAKAEMMRMTTS